MPELPEVETVRRDLEATYAGRSLDHVQVTGRRTVRRHLPDQLTTLEGRVLSAVGRRGKYLVFGWDDGRVMVAHLRMSGQLLATSAGAPQLPHTHAVMKFAGAGELHFVDPRTFGELFIAQQDLPELAHMGPDALEVTATQMGGALARRRAPLKALLVDQHVVAGIGNIYADEICWQARLRPDRPGGSLTPRQVKRLTESVHSVLLAAVAARGSTLQDQRYLDASGQAGAYQLQHQAYGRAGKPCGRCGRPVQRARIGAKSAYFCAHCQR